ncbi:MAG: dTMP kinase [Candidatus Binatia bacterium]
MIRLISFEGGDGSGKTTQIKLLEAHLASRGKICLLTREPGGTTLGGLIRRVLVEGVREEIACQAELFLYLADRAQHVREVVRPAIESGRFVLCDRFTDSTLAYQGYGRGVDLPLLRRMNRFASGGIEPDLTLLLDCSVEVTLSRARARVAEQQSRGSHEDRFETEGLEFHERVRRGFLDLARAEPDRIAVLDASAPILAVHEEVKKIVDQRLRSSEK